ncbi:MAG: pseudaminic acid synthase [Holosporaceae bacterium]|jgi:N-acetylneuraminate synthase/pseudaminic acid synthase|nr:pseudaminic acid synthase [Holosporaceae bacterium]
MKIRNVELSDVKNTYLLFMDKSVRATAKECRTITFEEHETWFRNRMLCEGFYILESKAGSFMGQVRIDKKNGENVISVELVEEYRSMGYGSVALARSLKMSNARAISAYIRLDNTASIKIFEKNGFKKASCNGLFAKYVYFDKTFIIAEMSANHCGDMNLAKKIIASAKECGANAIKLQTYTADTITIDCKNDYFKISGGTLWDDRYLYDLYGEAYTPWGWQQELKNYAESIGIELFSTPASSSAVDFLESIGVGRYKIASFEAIDYNLVKYTASKQKPMIISVGISSLEEMQEAVDACKSVGNDDITLLKCTSSYPAPLENMNLLTIPDMIQRFGPQGVKIGLSDHSMNVETVVAAVALGAKVIEKHFTLDRALGGADAAFSINPAELKATVEAVRNTEKVLGCVDYSVNEKSRKFSRSLFVCEDIKKGEKFSAENVRSIRPDDGLHPKYYDSVIGKNAVSDLKCGTPLRFEDIE